MESIRKSKVLHADETSLSMNEKTVWVWVFYDPHTQNVYFAIRESRGRDVLQEILPGLRGTLICDRWRPYRQFIIQHCFAHLLNEVRHIAEQDGSDGARAVYEWLLRLYKRACGVRGSKEYRKGEQRKLRLVVSYMVRKHDGHPVLGAFMTKLANAKKDMFRFVVDPALPPTNNAAEHQIREVVVHRKIRDCIRSEHTME